MKHAARGDPAAAEILKGLLADDRAKLTPGVKRARVAVGVCTVMRPGMLARCLDAIAAQIVPAGVEMQVVVADNEATPRSESGMQAFADRCGFPVHYVHEPRRGIPQARNAVLAQCRTLDVDWIAFTDDDCWVSPDWLASLLDAAARHGADVVYGRRDFLYSNPTQFWAMSLEKKVPAEGEVLPFAATHNVLFAARLIGPEPLLTLTFDERLTHGEDTDFFYRAARRGARIVYSHEPVVLEWVTPERATLGYHARRAYHSAASRSHFHLRYRGLRVAGLKLAVRWALQAPVAMARLASAPLIWLLSEQKFKSCVLKGSVRLAAAAGAAAGLLGFEGNPYSTIDGY
jgi:succinoglycan biosynthesis protein ExoM